MIIIYIKPARPTGNTSFRHFFVPVVRAGSGNAGFRHFFCAGRPPLPASATAGRRHCRKPILPEAVPDPAMAVSGNFFVPDGRQWRQPAVAAIRQWRLLQPCSQLLSASQINIKSTHFFISFYFILNKGVRLIHSFMYTSQQTN